MLGYVRHATHSFSSMRSKRRWPLTAKVAIVSLAVVAAVALFGLVVEDSFVPLGTALIAGSSAIVGAWLAGHWQEQQARVQLQLSNRSTAYLLLAEFLVRLRAMANTPASAAEDLNDLADVLDSDHWWTLQANVETFASPDVRAAFDAILTARARLRTALASWNEQRAMPADSRPPSGPALDELETRRKEVLASIKELLDRMNLELSGDESRPGS